VVSFPGSQVGIALELKACFPICGHEQRFASGRARHTPTFTRRDLCYRYTDVEFTEFACGSDDIVVARPYGGLGEAPERRMPKVLLIAIVEDDWLFRDSMRSLMKSLGYSVEVFSSAAEFLASPHLIETACLIADVQMPAMTGVELYRHLIDTGYAIPTILVTAHPNAADRTRALNDGVVCYLRKPVDEQHLMRCLRTALSSAELPNEDS
jgi:CheY-like chemotaxis protein